MNHKEMIAIKRYDDQISAFCKDVNVVSPKVISVSKVWNFKILGFFLT